MRAPCAYCGQPADHMDHVIPKATEHRFDGDFPYIGERVASCKSCNWLKGTRLLIPPSWTQRLGQLNALGVGTFRVWHGDRETLRETVK